MYVLLVILVVNLEVSNFAATFYSPNDLVIDFLFVVSIFRVKTEELLQVSSKYNKSIVYK
jgi:hypothetical protein